MLKKMILIHFFMILFIVEVDFIVAQVNNDSDIPETVQKSFNRKFPRAEDIAWEKVDTNYKADCFFNGRGTYAEFTPEGEWVMTITDLDLNTLYRPIQNYLDENFKRDKIIFAEEANKADRQDYFYVQLERKDPETKEPYRIELFFDKTGRIEQVKIPEGVNDMTIVGFDDPNSEIPEVVIDSWQKRFPRAEEIEWTRKGNNFVASFIYRDQPTHAEFTPAGDWVEARAKLDEKELHRLILTYIEEHHKDDDFIIGEKVTRADRKDYFYIKMEREVRGESQPYVFELFFDRAGQIQQVNRPEVLRNQYLLTVDIPDLVARKFKSRFAGASDVTWQTNDNTWVSTFIYREEPTTAIFSDSADWIQTTSQVNVKDLYSPIQRYLDENYKDYNPTYAEKVTRKDRNNYYYVELVSKKKNVDPLKLALYFDSAGRLKED
jgi:hypothetical protein